MASIGYIGASARRLRFDDLRVSDRMRFRLPRGLVVSLVLAGMALTVASAAGLLAVRRTDQVEASAQAALRRELIAGLVAAPVPLVNQPAGDNQVPVPIQFLPEQPPLAAGSPIAFIRIPAIGLDKVIVEGTGTAQLRTGPGHYRGTAMPGEGTFGLAGYRYTYGAPFSQLGDLNSTDKIYVTTAEGLFTYRVTSLKTVRPSENSALSSDGEERLVISTTAPSLRDDRRLVVTATLKEHSERAASKLQLPAADAAAAYPEQDPVVDAFELNPLGRLAAVNVTPNKPAPPPAPAPAAPGASVTGEPGASLPGAPAVTLPVPPPPPPPPSPAPIVVVAPPKPPPPPPAPPAPTGPIHRSPNRFAPACRNGIDDDGDGFIDFRSLDGERQDSGCNGENDEDE